MPQSPGRMRCPKCGNEMNHHADKLVYARVAESQESDTLLGGLIEETHACPRCGNVEARRA